MSDMAYNPCGGEDMLSSIGIGIVRVACVVGICHYCCCVVMVWHMCWSRMLKLLMNWVCYIMVVGHNRWNDDVFIEAGVGLLLCCRWWSSVFVAIGVFI